MTHQQHQYTRTVLQDSLFGVLGETGFQFVLMLAMRLLTTTIGFVTWLMFG